MWLTGIFLGTALNFLEPIQIASNFQQSVPSKQITVNNLKLFTLNQSRQSNTTDIKYFLAARDKTTVEQPFVINTLTLDPNQTNLNHQNNYSETDQPANFKPGVASWRTNSKLGSLKFNGHFNSQAQFTEGKAFWQTNTDIGSIDLAVNLNQQIKPIKSTAGWHTDTSVGSLAIQGNFDERTAFTGGNTAWKAKTYLGSLAIQGNFDKHTSTLRLK